MQKNKIFIASDFHLGAPDKKESDLREKRIVEWLEYIKPQADTLILAGDIFDFWYEWKNVVPKGFVRFLGKLAELIDSGTRIIFFSGNHDIWTYSYLTDELGIKIYRSPQLLDFNGYKIYVGHGDGLTIKHDKKYRFLKAIFTNKILQFMFSYFLHPDSAIKIGKKWSLSRKAFDRNPTFKGEEEWLVEYCRMMMQSIDTDCFVFGHRHCAAEYSLNEKTKYINTGVWFKESPYAEISDKQIKLKFF